MLRRLVREQRGQASAELVGMLWWMLLCALVVWQLLLAAWSVDQAANAARTASRVEGRGGDAEKAARYAVSDGLREGPEGRRLGRDGQGQRAHPDRVPGPRRRPPARDAQCHTPGLTHGPARSHRRRPRPRARTAPRDGVGYYRQRLLEEVDLNEIAVLSEEQKRARLERVVGRMVSREGPVLTTAERARLIRRVVDEAVGLGVLEPLLADDSVTEIMVNGTDEIYVERAGRIERADISFSDEAQLFQTIDRIVSTVNRRVDESSPMVDARLPTGERVNVIIPPLALKGPTMTIRRFPRLFTIDELVRIRSIDQRDRGPAARARAGAAEHRHLRRHRRGQDDAAERALLGRARTASASSPSRTTPSCACSSRTWSRSRRARPTSRARARSRSATSCATRCACGPDRIIVGEVRGAETVDMLQALNTGHEGSLVTLHANSCDDAIHRLSDAGLDERAADPVRGAARPDQLGDRRDRAGRPLRRRRAGA